MKLDNSGIKRLAAAIIGQAYKDLKSPCARLRNEALEFFEHPPSPWLSIVDMHPDFARKRIAADLEAARNKSSCSKLNTRKSGDKVCPVCNTTITKA